MQNKFARGVYALLDDTLSRERPLVDLADQVLQGGIRVLQLRLKRTGDRQALKIIRDVMQLAHFSESTVIVNDRVDLALLGGAHGVHVGADDVPVALARRILGPASFIGATCRTLADIENAKAAGADHVGLGPVFETTTKRVDAALLGIEGLARIVKVSPLPVVAIAGITFENVNAVARTGAHCAAIGSALLNAGDLKAMAEKVQREFLR